jgi:hypothetical protein
MSDILSNSEIQLYDPGSIPPDIGGTDITYTDTRKRIRSVNSNLSVGTNFENTLGPKYLQKMAGTLWEAVFKTAATCIPAGKTLKVAIALTGAKILTKSVGTAGNYVIADDYKVKKAFKKGLIINTFTPTNFAPLLQSTSIKNTLVGKTFGSYYTTLSGNGKSSNILQQGRIDYLDFHLPKILGGGHYHGSLYPLNPLLQAESKVTGYAVYDIISGKNIHEVAHTNEIHNNDIQHIQEVKDTHQQGTTQQNQLHPQVEPKSGGGHDESEYQGAFLPFTVELTRAINNKVKAAYQDGKEIEAGIDFATSIWENKIKSADGILDTTLEVVKGLPTQFANEAYRDLILFNRYVSIPAFDLVTGGVAESVEAIDKSLENVANYALAAGAIAYAKASDFLTNRGGASAPNPYEEVVIVTDGRGKKTTKFVAKARTDNTRTVKPPSAKLLVDVKKEQQEADDAYRTLVGWNKTNNSPKVNQNSSAFAASQSAIYGAAGKPKSNFTGYTGFGSTFPLATGGVRVQQNAANRATITQLFK